MGQRTNMIDTNFVGVQLIMFNVTTGFKLFLEKVIKMLLIFQAYPADCCKNTLLLIAPIKNERTEKKGKN